MATDQEVDKLSEAEAGAGAPQTKDKAQSKDKVNPQSKFSSYISQARLKLNPGLDYVLDGFPPVIAVIALIVAVLAMNESRSLRTQLGTAVAKIESLSSNKSFASREDFDKVKASVAGIDKGKASIEELEKVKAVLAQDKVTHDAELNKQSERNAKIIHGVSKLQVKMKISPTLETQMRESVAVPIAAPSPAPKAATAPVAAIVPTSAPVPAKAVAPSPAPAPAKQIILSMPEAPAVAKPAPVKPATKAEVPTAKAPVTIVRGDTKKEREAQVKSIKEQIDEFNKK